MEIELPRYAARIVALLEQSGFEAWFVGGAVRDSLLKKTPQDWDVATNALPAQIKQVFRDYPTVDTGLKHGTVTVVADNRPIEVTTYRIDGVYDDCRHPEQVIFTNDISRDLQRRDFTINAIAYHPQRGLLDGTGGVCDLERGIIRCVGDPAARFQEDALRILRALRFASVLEFEIEPRTALALKQNRALLQHIAVERIQDELTKLLCGRHVRQVLSEYQEVIAEVIPEIRPMFGFDQKNPHHYLDVWNHTLTALESSEPVLPVRLALLFHDIGKPAAFTLDSKGIGHFYGHPEISELIAAAVMKRLRFDNETMLRVRQLIRWHDSDILPEGKSVKRWLNRLGEEGMRQLLQVKAADRSATNHKYENLSVLSLIEKKVDAVIREGQCFTRDKLQINGRDLLGLGIPEGKQIGEILDNLLDLVIGEQLPNQRTVLLNRAKTMAEKQERLL